MLDLYSLALWPQRKQIKHLALDCLAFDCLPLDYNIAFLEAVSVIMLHFALEWFCLQNRYVGLDELESRE